MAQQQALMLRGWNESGMGRAMALAHDGTNFISTSAEYQEACDLHERGELWSNFTDKSGGSAQRAEDLLQCRFDDLFSDDLDEGNPWDGAPVVMAQRPDDVEPALQDPSQAGMWDLLQSQGTAHQASLTYHLTVLPQSNP